MKTYIHTISCTQKSLQPSLSTQSGQSPEVLQQVKGPKALRPIDTIEHHLASASSWENWMTPQTTTMSQTRSFPIGFLRFPSENNRIIERITCWQCQEFGTAGKWERALKDSAIGWNLMTLPGLLSLHLPSQHTRITGMRHWAWLSPVGSGDLNSGPQSCKQGPLPIVSIPQPSTLTLYSFMWVYNHLKIKVSTENKWDHDFSWTGSGVGLGQEGSQVWPITAKKFAKSRPLKLAQNSIRAQHTPTQRLRSLVK